MAAELLANPASKAGAIEITNGSCLCGSITYTVSGTPSTTVLCHCTSCKKPSGSAFMANNFYEASKLNITGPTSTLKKYNDTSPDAGGFVQRYFCGDCGSNIFIKNSKWENAVIVATGTLDYEEALTEWKPDAEFFCKRRGPWLSNAGAIEEKKFNAMT
ncbi:hypothetical protein LHYA1_G001519 [Lachnellula hyalina]|uniref:CENP-V/GFA domain-containing protein n=1 Tax=Lachnellula hyalina TaxID=1316788 RepID=A0A8H8U302_9HELO|nr:uncharacterized protein LHYA1_G001519 [Lachnellula hyalina]TVY29543.1 hypothetical protein LHYA1_G001519 [Lachnellula hyalina]